MIYGWHYLKCEEVLPGDLVELGGTILKVQRILEYPKHRAFGFFQGRYTMVMKGRELRVKRL